MKKNGHTTFKRQLARLLAIAIAVATPKPAICPTLNDQPPEQVAAARQNKPAAARKP